MKRFVIGAALAVVICLFASACKDANKKTETGNSGEVQNSQDLSNSSDPIRTSKPEQSSQSSTKPQSIEFQLAQIFEAMASESYSLAANRVDNVLKADFSQTPLSKADIWDMQTEFAQIYAAADRTDDAINLLQAVLKESDTALSESAEIQPETTDRDQIAMMNVSAANNNPDAKGYRSEQSLLNADRYQMLADLQFSMGDYVKAYESYGTAKAMRGFIFGFGTDLPDEAYLVEQRYRSAQLGKMPYDVFCSLEYEFGEIPLAERSIEKIEYWNERTEHDICPPAFAAGMSFPEEAEYETLTVYYGTSRQITKKKNVEKRFNAETAPLSLGSIDMTVPLNREVGTIQIPGVLDFWGAQDGVHIVLRRITPEGDKAKFQRELSEHIRSNKSDEKEAFIYVHGHAVSFANAARRTAQLAVDLDMRYGGMFYSWPAGANVVSYFKSQKNVDHAAKELEEFLTLVTAVKDIDTLHVIAHSMGNDVLSTALQNMELEGFSADNRPFGQIVWASPDVDAREFAKRVEEFTDNKLADGMTLYASDKDKALSVSQWIWDKFPRAGQAPPNPDVAKLVQTIDTSQIDRKPSDLLAHGDYASAAIDDMRAVIWLSLMPARRCSLASRNIDGVTYWSANKTDTSCDKTVYREAIELARMELQPMNSRQIDPMFIDRQVTFVSAPMISETGEVIPPPKTPAESMAEEFLSSRRAR